MSTSPDTPPRRRRRSDAEKADAARSAPSIVFVGIMGAGKSCIGRRVAEALSLPFVDADEEIEKAAGRSIADIFESFGEPEFRAGERRVIARLLQGGRRVIATGGGAFLDPDTRALIRERAISVWLKADLDTLMERVSRRDHRPLLKTDDPRAVMERLLAARAPVYAEADMAVDSLPGPHARTVTAVLDALAAHAKDLR